MEVTYITIDVAFCDGLLAKFVGGVTVTIVTFFHWRPLVYHLV